MLCASSDEVLSADNMQWRAFLVSWRGGQLKPSVRSAAHTGASRDRVYIFRALMFGIFFLINSLFEFV